MIPLRLSLTLFLQAITWCVFAQSESRHIIPDTVFIYFNYVEFTTPQKVYRCTKYTDKDGDFFFDIGRMDSNFIDKGITFYKKGMYINKYVYLRLVDTITAYNTEYLDTNKLIEFDNKSIQYENYPILESLRYSYVLKRLDITSFQVDSCVQLRIFRFNDYIKDLNDWQLKKQRSRYEVLSIKLYNDYALLLRSVLSPKPLGGFSIQHDSATIVNKSFKKLKQTINIADITSDIECRIPNGDDHRILEYLNGTQYCRYIINFPCLRGKKEIRKKVNIVYYIPNLMGKYLN